MKMKIHFSYLNAFHSFIYFLPNKNNFYLKKKLRLKTKKGQNVKKKKDNVLWLNVRKFAHLIIQMIIKKKCSLLNVHLRNTFLICTQKCIILIQMNL